MALRFQLASDDFKSFDIRRIACRHYAKRAVFYFDFHLARRALANHHRVPFLGVGHNLINNLLVHNATLTVRFSPPIKTECMFKQIITAKL